MIITPFAWRCSKKCWPTLTSCSIRWRYDFSLSRIPLTTRWRIRSCSARFFSGESSFLSSSAIWNKMTFSSEITGKFSSWHYIHVGFYIFKTWHYIRDHLYHNNSCWKITDIKLALVISNLQGLEFCFEVTVAWNKIRWNVSNIQKSRLNLVFFNPL